jgi:MFS transporter, FHS family, glucose/mannose:H+ symporter
VKGGSFGMDDSVEKSNTWAFYPLMIVPGIVLLLAPSTVETIMEFFGFRESLGGLLQVSYFAGGVIGILLITRMMQRYGVKQIALSQVALLSASLIAASFSPWYPLLLAFMLVAGFANGILIAFPGVYVTGVSGSRSHGPQNVLYSFFALGVVTGPLLSSLMINDDPAMWRWAFRAPALLIIPLAVPVALVTFRKLEGVKALSRDTMRRVLGYNRGLFYGLLGALVLYIAAESAASMWLITYLEEEHGLSGGSAHWALTGMWLGIVAGRLVCGWLTRRVDPYRVLFFLVIASGITLLVAPLTGSTAASLILYPLIGLFYSGIYPILIGYASWFPPDLNSTVFTVFVAAGAAGGAVLPYLVGLVNQFAGLVLGMSSISLALFGVLACLFWLREHVLDGSPGWTEA